MGGTPARPSATPLYHPAASRKGVGLWALTVANALEKEKGQRLPSTDKKRELTALGAEGQAPAKKTITGRSSGCQGPGAVCSLLMESPGFFFFFLLFTLLQTLRFAGVPLPPDTFLPWLLCTCCLLS